VDLKEILKRLKLSEQNISMILGGLVIVVIGILIFNYFRGVGRKIEAPTGQPTSGEVKLIEEEGGKLVPEGLPKTYKVQKGDHLWMIAEKNFGSGYNWVDIAKENNLANPNRLLVGQELIIPKAEVIKPAEMPVTGQAGAINQGSHTVQKGDSLWTVAVRAYGDGYQWTKIWQANETLVKNPDIIQPGQVLSIPR
jgi:putative chitinase